MLVEPLGKLDIPRYRRLRERPDLLDQTRWQQPSARRFVVCQALAEGATDRQSLRDKMATAKDFKDVSGIASFDENRDAVMTQQQISVVQDQKWQLYTTFQ